MDADKLVEQIEDYAKILFHAAEKLKDQKQQIVDQQEEIKQLKGYRTAYSSLEKAIEFHNSNINKKLN